MKYTAEEPVDILNVDMLDVQRQMDKVGNVVRDQVERHVAQSMDADVKSGDLHPHVWNKRA